MKLTKKQGGNFLPHEEGTFRAVCVDVTPLVKQQSKFGEREVFRLVFETDAPEREDGSRQCVWSRGFTPSLNEKANFRKFMRQWLGRDLTPAEETELDTEDLIGRGANVVVTHEVGENGETYANIVACTVCKKDALKPSGKFTRKKDREEPAGEGASYRGAAKPSEKQADAHPVDETQAGADWTCVKVHVGKHSGVELRDLDAEAITKLATNWLPRHNSNAKPTADDKRLAAALKLAVEAVNEAPKEDF
ncbi:MAG: hypothetical protein WCQ16_07880 [Verrucomicrobiae bacterium]